MSITRKPRKREHIKRFTVELDPPEYELLSELAKIMDMSKAEIVRLSLRHYFSYTLLTLYAPELKELLDFLKERLKHGKPR